MVFSTNGEAEISADAVYVCQNLSLWQLFACCWCWRWRCPTYLLYRIQRKKVMKVMNLSLNLPNYICFDLLWIC